MSTRRLGTLLALLVPLAALAIAPASCGTSDDAPRRDKNPDDPGDDGGTSDDAGDGEGDSGDKPAYTLGEVCDVLANAQCAAIESCCGSVGVGYDEAGCKAGLKKGCEARAAKVAAGKLTFGPESVDACNAAMATIYGKCQLSWEETADMLLGVPACRDVFAGTKAAGDACAATDECKPPQGASQMAVCEDAVCVTRDKFLGEGDDCTLGGPACGGGLYCNADLTTKEGKCEKVKAAGDACDKKQEAAAKVECGWGNHCDSQGRCVTGKAAGEACTESTWNVCQSYVCTNNQCAPLTVANEATCKGEAGTP